MKKVCVKISSICKSSNLIPDCMRTHEAPQIILVEAKLEVKLEVLFK